MQSQDGDKSHSGRSPGRLFVRDREPESSKAAVSGGTEGEWNFMKPHKGIDFSECISQPQFPWIPALRPASVKMGRGSGRNDDLKAFTLDPSPDQLTAPVSRVAP